MESSCHDRLSHSLWALGIVTGDNKNKVKKEKAEGLEPVYAGKQVAPLSFRMNHHIFCLNQKISNNVQRRISSEPQRN